MRGAGVAIEPQKIFEPPLRIILDVDANPRVPDGQGGGARSLHVPLANTPFGSFFPIIVRAPPAPNLSAPAK